MKVRILRRLLLVVLLAISSTAARAELPKAKAIAPDNHVQLKDTASGTYYVAKPLKEEYDRLLSRLKTLQADIESERTSGAEALSSLKSLQTDLVRLRDEIEKKKLFVPVAKTHVQTETLTFDLGSEKLLVITADNVRLVGWEGPGVKVEFEKVILSADGKLDEAELKGLKVVHKHSRVPEQVGLTKEENDIREAAYLKTKDGQALKPESIEWRRKFHGEIQAHNAIYKDFQAKEVDTLEIEGLTHEQGNRQMTLEVNSKDGNGSYRSVWRRHAELTVYVPPCKAVAIRGGLEKLDIEKIKSSLVITADDSQNRDYHSESRIRGVTGSVAARNVPLHTIEDVSGDVSLTCTVDLANSGTSHDGGSDPGQVLRTFHVFRALPCFVKNVGGNFQAWLCRIELEAVDIAGRIDVRNEFGDTRLKLTKPLAKVTHRIVSEAGRIEVNFSAANLGELPLWAVTQCGGVRTNSPRELLDSFNYSQGTTSEGVSRKWSGLRRAKKPNAEFDSSEWMESIERADKALHGLARSAGLDLISRGGIVVVTVTK
ncbi:MAG: hypothetical protein ACKVP0_00760 [Pirellulaceae bacterium]